MMNKTTATPENSFPDCSCCLATVTSTDFVPGTLVMIVSFLEHNSWFSGDIVIIHDDLPEEEQLVFSCFENVTFLSVGDELKARVAELIRSVPGRGMEPKTARFYSLEVFRLTGYDKVLYCDSDLLIQGDLRDLFQIPATDESHRLLCCPDRWYYYGRLTDPETFLPGPVNAGPDHPPHHVHQTFNSGFMLIDGIYFDGQHYRNMLKLLVPETWQKTTLGQTDQIVLNLYFRNRFHLLSGRYNFYFGHSKAIFEKENLRFDDIRVIHYTGKAKPWTLNRVIHKASNNPAIIRFVGEWHNRYIRFLPLFHLKSHAMKGNLKKETDVLKLPGAAD